MRVTARVGWGVWVSSVAVLACDAVRTPPSEAVLPAAEERSAAGASAVVPAAGAPGESGGVGGNAASPAGSSPSGLGGSDTGAGEGASGGAAGSGDGGASGRDGDSHDSDELRYAIWIEPTPSADAPRGARHVASP